MRSIGRAIAERSNAHARVCKDGPVFDVRDVQL